MQVTETVSEGLKREFQVTVPAADLETRAAGRLAEMKDRAKLPGFRPGKVPVTHLRKLYGRSVMAETVETVIRELNAQIVEERGLKQVTDTGAIEALVERLIADNPGQVATVQKNPKVAGWFTGQVMKATGGKASPGMVNEIVARKLGLG